MNAIPHGGNDVNHSPVRPEGIDEGSVVVGHAEGPGRIVLETVDAVRERVWAAAPGAGQLDSVKDVRQMRAADNRISDSDANHRTEVDGPGRDEVGLALLEHLGL